MYGWFVLGFVGVFLGVRGRVCCFRVVFGLEGEGDVVFVFYRDVYCGLG